jgi:hypothetical protein
MVLLSGNFALFGQFLPDCRYSRLVLFSGDRQRIAADNSLDSNRERGADFRAV